MSAAEYNRRTRQNAEAKRSEYRAWLKTLCGYDARNYRVSYPVYRKYERWGGNYELHNCQS